MDSQKKKINIFLNLTFMTFLILSSILILSSLVANKITDNTYVKEIGRNWIQGVITDLTEDGSACKNGENYLIEEKWPGTKEGCDCSRLSPNVLAKKRIDPVRLGPCSLDDSTERIFCKALPAIDPMIYKSWKGISLCGKRSVKNYLEHTIAKNFTECLTKGLKPCGIIDNFNNILCLPLAEICPYNHFKIFNEKGAYLFTKENVNELYFDQFYNSKRNFSITNKTTSNFVFYPDKEKKRVLNGIESQIVASPLELEENKITIDKKDYLSTEYEKIDKNALQMPEVIVDLRIEEGVPCAYKANKNYNSKLFILDSFFSKGNKCVSHYTNDKSDNSYKIIDSSNENELLKLNQIFDKVSKIPTYPNKNDSLVNLYYRNYIGLDRRCHNRVNIETKPTEFIKNFVNSDEILRDLSSLSIAGFLLVIIGGLIEVFLMFYLVPRDKHLLAFIFYILFIVICGIPNFIIGIFLSQFASNALNNLDMVINESCLDNLSYLSTKNYFINLKIILVCAVIFLFLYIFLITIQVFKSITRFNLLKRQKDEELLDDVYLGKYERSNSDR